MKSGDAYDEILVFCSILHSSFLIQDSAPPQANQFYAKFPPTNSSLFN